MKDLKALDEFRRSQGWGFDHLASAMKRAGFPVSATTLQRLLTGLTRRPPHDRTLHRVRQFLALVERGELPPDPPLVDTEPRPSLWTADPPPPPVARHRHRYLVGETLPLVLTLDDFADLLMVSPSTIWRHRRDFAALEPTGRLGRRPRYSGPKIQRWLDGEDLVRYTRPRR